MTIITPYRPLVSPVPQVQPHVVQATVGSILVQPVKATVATPDSGTLTPDFFVSGTGDDGDDGTTPGTAWQTIAKVNTESAGFAPGTIVGFNGGDTFTGATLTPAADGTAGNLITFTSYGTGQAIIDGQDVRNPVSLNGVDYIRIDNMQGRDTGTGAASAMIRMQNSHNCEITNMTIGPQTDLTSGGFGIRLTTSNGTLVENCTVDDVGAGGIFIGSGTNGTIRDCTILDYGLNTGGTQGDGFNIQNEGGSGWLVTGCTFNHASGPATENCLDIKSGVQTVENCIFIRAKAELIIIHEGNGTGIQTNVTLNDCEVYGGVLNGQNNGGTEDSIATWNRTLIQSDGGRFRAGAGGGGAGTFTFNACAFYAAAGDATTFFVELREGAAVAFYNCTFESLNGNTMSQHIQVNADFTGTCEARNCIFKSNGTNPDVSNNVGAITWSNNVYNVGSGQNPGGVNSTTNATTFASTDPTNADFLLPNAGSSCLDRGNATYAPATDFSGTAYDNPPNAGCREGNA